MLLEGIPARLLRLYLVFRDVVYAWFLNSTFPLENNRKQLALSSRLLRHIAGHDFDQVFKILQSLNDFWVLILENAGEHLLNASAK